MLAAVVLAAGGGTRFEGDTPKLLAEWRGRPLASWAIRAAVDAAIGPVWVVTGAVDLSAAIPPGVSTLCNPRWAEGQATSLATALREAYGQGLQSLVVGLADQPLVTADAWMAVAASTGPIAVATYGGTRANPVMLAREVWDLLPITGDQGARRLMASRPELVVEVACDGNPADIDTMDDMRHIG